MYFAKAGNQQETFSACIHAVLLKDSQSTMIPSPLADYMEFIPDWDAYVSHLRLSLPVYFRINTLKASREVVFSTLDSEGIRPEATAVKDLFKLGATGQARATVSYHLGYIYPQALSSALPVIALAPRPGEMVLDLCAAPGGKATHMAQVMGDSGIIIANDRKLGRLTALLSNVKRLGITNTVVTHYRGEHFPVTRSFDRVLVDAPCSGDGKFRLGKDDEILHLKKGRTFLPAIQKALIQRAFDLLRPGGTMVYSTCTLNPQENEEVVSHLLKKRDGRLLSWVPPIDWEPGLTTFKGRGYHESCVLCRRFYPHKIDSVGFFVAKIFRPI